VFANPFIINEDKAEQKPEKRMETYEIYIRPF